MGQNFTSVRKGLGVRQREQPVPQGIMVLFPKSQGKSWGGNNRERAPQLNAQSSPQQESSYIHKASSSSHSDRLSARVITPMRTMRTTYSKAYLPEQNENKLLGSKKCRHIKGAIIWGRGKLPILCDRYPENSSTDMQRRACGNPDRDWTDTSISQGTQRNIPRPEEARKT